MYLFEALQIGDESRIEEAIGEFARLDELEKVAALGQISLLLESPDVEYRWWCVRALAEVGDPQAGALRLQALQDEDWRVRQCAAIALRLHPNPQAVTGLIDLLNSAAKDLEDGALTARLAADALVSLGSPAVPALIAVLQDGSQAARLQAGRALAQIGDPRAIPDLIKSLDEDSALLEYWANIGLEKMGVGMAFFIPE